MRGKSFFPFFGKYQPVAHSHLKNATAGLDQCCLNTNSIF